ncbi:Transcriptional regulatory protein YpdB [Caloramator mitchellensis]|uniref:Stage 0 sporulation protein A homolog n=1 Tax=Caloramator mitchellensis TaxID=908809 RepID=A0A0R3K2F8_CALMK|nr:LytTR family DNA-binding domain-containing protein [Caloramator mitchellensis]KRQ87157.1 Transcriptional regulatory protein YpdB [Caloramator mitchellensis]
MSNIRCIIVEDEIPAILELKYILQEYECMDIIKEFYDGKSALDWMIKNDIDVIFLDINMPNMGGLDLAKEILKLEKDIHLVFITAHEDFALNAFELGAIDYILKPYNEKRIEKTILRIKEHVFDRKKSESDVARKIEKIISKINMPAKVKKIACEYKGKTLLVDLEDIYYCFIEDEETYVKTKDISYLTNYNLNELEEKTGFFRIHRSFIVNLNKIKEIYPWFNGTYKITMDDIQKSELQVSRSRVKELKEALNI